MITVSARAAALRILAARTGTQEQVPTTYELADFQTEAVSRAFATLRRRAGVILADDVGLGKTFMAAALLEHELARGNTTVVVIPASLRANWRRALRPLLDRFGAALRFLTHGELSRGASIDPPRFVVVDEAHGFRNPKTRRYRQLRLLCRSAKVLLLTATPVNNSLADLYFQIRLFAGDAAFRDLGIGSLRALLTSPEPDPSALARLRRDVIIRRTNDDLPPESRRNFPSQTLLETVRYAPSVQPDEIRELIDGLEFVTYPDEPARLLVKLALLKRLQSSRDAALASIRRLIRIHRDWLAALASGRWLTPQVRVRGDDDQLELLDLIVPAVPPSVDVRYAKRLADRDLALLQEAHARLSTRRDEKLETLAQLITARAPPIVVFTEFRDTAFALARALRGFQPGLITGRSAFLGEHPASREEVIRRFAPRANGAPEPAPAERVHVLIATDVLSEGLNLQDASAVVSYDLPWNPVRLMQRAGRICRFGSPHDVVRVYNFLPDAGLEDFLGLVRRIRAKLRDFRSALGPGAAVLEPDEDPGRFLAVPRDITSEVEPDELAPSGAVGILSPNGRHVLLCFQRNGAVRELIYTDGSISGAGEKAEAVLRAALDSGAELAAGDPCMLDAALAAAREYLAQEQIAVADSAVSALAAAVRRAVEQLGLLCTPGILALADEVLAQATSYNGLLSTDLARLRAATSPDRLEAALREVLDSCRGGGEPADGAWELVAAIATD